MWALYSLYDGSFEVKHWDTACTFVASGSGFKLPIRGQTTRTRIDFIESPAGPES